MSQARDLADLGSSAEQGAVTGDNFIINGDMSIAQRGTTGTDGGYQTIDRWKTERSGDVTQSQVDLTSSDTPYSYGFRKALKVENTSNSNAAGDYTQIIQIIEAQNVANSGWDYTSSSSYVTLQFWVKSSLAGTYSAFLLTRDGTQKTHSFQFTLVADTWKKVTYTFAGDSSITIDNNKESGLEVFVVPHYGTSYTTSGHTDNVWQTYSATDITGDYAQNWKNTSNATFFVTGAKLEVGSTATPFKHESYEENLAKCQRYYQRVIGQNTASGVIAGASFNNTTHYLVYHHPVSMRSTATVGKSALADLIIVGTGTSKTATGFSRAGGSTETSEITVNSAAIGAAGGAVWLRINAADKWIEFKAEL